MKNIKSIILTTFLVFFFAVFVSCGGNKKANSQNEDTSWQSNLASDSLSWAENWIDDSGRTDRIQYRFENGSLRFWTDSGSRQRPKVTHKSREFTTGQYFWRVYVPKMGLYERASVGAFLYHDGDHELDFEIGSGQKAIRDSIGVKDDELVVYLTSQELPAHQKIIPIKPEQWYDLSMKLSETNDNKYFLEWFINGELMDSVKLEYGPEIKFGIHSSLENIDFIGDTIASQDHYCLFEKVGFKPIN